MAIYEIESYDEDKMCHVVVNRDSDKPFGNQSSNIKYLDLQVDGNFTDMEPEELVGKFIDLKSYFVHEAIAKEVKIIDNV